MITEKLEGIASGFKNKFGRAADYVNNPRNATKQMAQRKQPPVKALNVKKPKIGKVGSVDTAFYTKVSAGQNSKLRQGDSIADISAKLLSFIKKNEEDKKLHFELMRDFDKENIQEDERRHKELMDAFKKPKKKEKEERVETKKEVEKKAEEPTKETKKVDKAATEVKKETQAVPEKKAPEVAKPVEQPKKAPEPAKPVEVPKKVETPTAKPAAEAKPPVTAKPVEPAPAAPQVPPPTVTVPKPSIPSGVSTAAKVATTAIVLTAAQQSVASELEKAGLSPKAQANILAQVQSESNFKPQSEGLYYSAQGLANTWPNRFAVRDEKGAVITPHKPNTLALSIEKNPEKIANIVYGGRMGNTEEGDGWKYRGRGYIQITGKDAYKALSKALKIDLISNPDLLNDPVIAAKSIPWFFLSYKGKKPKDLENISVVNKSVGFQDHVSDKKTGETESQKRERLSQQFEGSIGEKIAQSSVENKELKTAQGNTVIIDNTSTTITSGGGGNQQQVIKVGSSSDLPIYQQG
jgi:putative chitinase